jgi:hypothetical protein
MVEDEAGSHLPIACARKILARLQFCSVRAGTVTIQAIWRAQLASLLEIHRLFFLSDYCFSAVVRRKAACIEAA